jgi:hypothetical protein
MRELEKEGDSIKEVTRSFTNEITNHYTGYDSSYYDSGAYGAGTPSTEANPSTVSVPAPQGAESSVSSTEAPVNGTVARTSPSYSPEHPSGHPSGDASNQPAEPESINT